MKSKKALGRKLYLLLAVPFVILAAAFIFFSLPPAHVSSQSVSGIQFRSQVWSGEITITGDVTILRDLTIMPGTVIKFEVQDDQGKGLEVGPDGFNDDDPTRLISYAQSHASLDINGKLLAQGTPEQPIIFTSAAAHPALADWEAVSPGGDGSIIEHATIEYSRNGISPVGSHLNSVFRNNVVRHTMWGCFSLGASSPQVISNEAYDCGHEAIDVNGGSPLIEGNTIHDSHTGIVVLKGSPQIRNNIIRSFGDGIHVEPGATPQLAGNRIEPAPPNSTSEWRYGSFAYTASDAPAPQTPQGAGSK